MSSYSDVDSDIEVIPMSRQNEGDNCNEVSDTKELKVPHGDMKKSQRRRARQPKTEEKEGTPKNKNSSSTPKHPRSRNSRTSPQKIKQNLEEINTEIHEPIEEKNEYRKSSSSSSSYSKPTSILPETKQEAPENEGFVAVQPDKEENTEEQVSIPLNIIVPSVKPKNTFAIVRETKTSIRGKSFTYTLNKEEEILYAAKCKGRRPKKPIVIKQGKEIHIKSGGEYYLCPEKDCTMYQLRKGDPSSGRTVMSFTIIHELGMLITPRHCDVQLFDFEGDTLIMTTKKPKMNPRGKYVLDFHNRFTIASEKNAIFINSSVNPREAQDLISVRKIGPTTLETISEPEFDPVIVFAIGLCLFTGNLG